MQSSSVQIGPQTQLCAVIGNPVSHSLSPAIHNAAFRALGLDFVYLAFRVEHLSQALDGMRALENFRGLSVTIPHKIEAMDHVDEVHDLDRRIGSINTILNRAGNLYGLGTDGPGALKALRDSDVTPEGSRVLILGAGGAARAIAFTLVDTAPPQQLTLLDVQPDLLEPLAKDLTSSARTEIHCHRFEPKTLAGHVDTADIIIHCTPVGMHPHVNESLIPTQLLHRDQVVFDIVYTPLETRLLALAKEAGAKTVSGVDMFIHQAVLQFEAFTGKPAPVAMMRRVVLEQLGQ